MVNFLKVIACAIGVILAVISFVTCFYITFMFQADFYAESIKEEIIYINEPLELTHLYDENSLNKINETIGNKVDIKDLQSIYAKYNENGNEDEIIYVFCKEHSFMKKIFYTKYNPCKVVEIYYDNEEKTIKEMKISEGNTLLMDIYYQNNVEFKTVFQY